MIAEYKLAKKGTKVDNSATPRKIISWSQLGIHMYTYNGNHHIITGGNVFVI